jgi:hypothetical protein
MTAVSLKLDTVKKMLPWFPETPADCPTSLLPVEEVAVGGPLIREAPLQVVQVGAASARADKSAQAGSATRRAGAFKAAARLEVEV